MARLIDADEITYYTDEQGFECAYKVDIDNLLTIDPEGLRPKAHWEGFQADGKDDLFEFALNAINICTKCKHISMQKSKYCPHCGAKMEKKTDET